MQKWNIPTDRAWIVDEKIGHFSSYHVCFCSHGH